MAVEMVPENHEPLLCTACGKDMKNPRTGTSIVGLHTGIYEDDVHPEDTAFYQRQWGDYAPAVKDGQFEADLCWECWMKSMGIPVPDGAAVEGD